MSTIHQGFLPAEPPDFERGTASSPLRDYLRTLIHRHPFLTVAGTAVAFTVHTRPGYNNHLHTTIDWRHTPHDPWSWTNEPIQRLHTDARQLRVGTAPPSPHVGAYGFAWALTLDTNDDPENSDDPDSIGLTVLPGLIAVGIDGTTVGAGTYLHPPIPWHLLKSLLLKAAAHD